MSQAAGQLTAEAPIEVLPREPTIGAEIRGVDLSQPVSAATAAAIHDALMAHKVIYFRDQDITPEQQLAFGRMFGEVTVHPFVPNLPHLPEVLVLDNHKDNPVFSTDTWHSDETFREEPPMGSILRCVDIPDTGGDTMWADMCAAYEGLSDKLRHFISGLEAIHDFKNFRHKFDGLPPRGAPSKAGRDGRTAPQPGASRGQDSPGDRRQGDFRQPAVHAADQGHA